MKTCPKCKINKKSYEYHANKRLKDGLSFYCKKCINSEALIGKIPNRICCYCYEVFAPVRTKTCFCSVKCYLMAKKDGIIGEIISLEESPSALPERAFIGADQEDCFI